MITTPHFPLIHPRRHIREDRLRVPLAAGLDLKFERPDFFTGRCHLQRSELLLGAEGADGADFDFAPRGRDHDIFISRRQAFEFQAIRQDERDCDVVVRLSALVFQVDAIGHLRADRDRLVESGDAQFQISRVGGRRDARSGNSRTGGPRRRDGRRCDVDASLADLNRSLVRGQAGFDEGRKVARCAKRNRFFCSSE